MDTKTLFRDIKEYQEYVQKTDDENLAFLWRIRHEQQKDLGFRSRSILWRELEDRYPGLTRVPITLNFPFFEQFNSRQLVEVTKEAIDKTDWPEYIKTWHK